MRPQEQLQIQAEEETGALGPPVSLADLKRLMPDIHLVTEKDNYDQQRLAIELARSEPVDEVAQRSIVRERIIANCLAGEQRNYYFVRQPGL